MNYLFGEYDLDTTLFELRKNGESVAIEPQVFSLLVYLIENRDRVISKDDLIRVVWNDRVVSDATLSSRIFSMRKAVGDTGEAQSVIRTIPRRGFRFVADITPTRHVSGISNASEDNTAEPNQRNTQVLTDAHAAVDTVVANADDLRLAAELPILAILPFKNANANLDEYFCDGLTEDIISNLTYFSEIRVIAGASSRQFKESSLGLSDIAKVLNADYIVDGSVRCEGIRLRISVQLVDVTKGVSIWAERYDREISDVFAVQDAVVHMIVASLGSKIQNASLMRALRKSPAKLDAYDHLLRARCYTATLDEKMHAEARDLLERAIELDPNYADAYALLANVYLAEYRFDVNKRPNPVDRALAMALTATRLDPQNAYAHCWLAIVHYFRKDNGKFEAEAKRALDLNPNDPEILAEIGHYLSYMGEFKRGIKLSERAQALNPLHPGWYHFGFARFHYHRCLYEEMLVDIQRISMPNFYWTHLLNAAALGQLGRGEARLSLEKMKELKPGISVHEEMHKWNLSPRDFDHLMDGLRKAGLN